ncbi:MAG: hypothetical protein QM759_09990 [Terricaulis sp.]
MKTTTAASLALLLLTACVAANGRLGAQLEQYHARHVQDLFAVLGPPTAETAIAAQEVYVWGDPRLAMLPQVTTPGAARDAAAPACTIRVFVSPDQRIESWDILGNDTTCGAYSARFSARH